MSVLVIPEFENEDEQLLEPENMIAQSVPDERANIPVSETTERFLRAVLAKVPLDRIEELHLFSPLRQGTAETGIAVIAARVVLPDPPESSELELQLEAGPDVEVDEAAAELVEAVEAAETTDAAEAEAEAEAEADADEAVATEEATDVVEVAAGEAPIHSDQDESPYADDPLPVAAEAMLDFAHELAPDVADELTFDPPVPRVRHTVYTARYRLVIKGPDRGKWEMDVVDEADAPLLAVESVVRGVQRRAGEETATVRYDATQLARVLRITPSPVP